jgi:hypothetical protein
MDDWLCSPEVESLYVFRFTLSSLRTFASLRGICLFFPSCSTCPASRGRTSSRIIRIIRIRRITHLLFASFALFVLFVLKFCLSLRCPPRKDSNANGANERMTRITHLLFASFALFVLFVLKFCLSFRCRSRLTGFTAKAQGCKELIVFPLWLCDFA